MQMSVICKFCKTSLTPKKFENRTWYTCTRCHSHYVPIESFKSVLIEPEFHKFNYDIRQGQIKSSDNCCICKARMIKIIDLLEDNQVEACAACRMVWLDPNEGEKIKKDQELILNSGKKIILSENGALEQQFYWEMGNFKRVRMYKDHGETYLDKYQRLSSRRPGLDWLIWVIWRYVKIDTTKAQVFAKSHPFITLILFLLLIIVSIKILAFLFAGGHLNFYRTSPRRYFFF